MPDLYRAVEAALTSAVGRPTRIERRIRLGGGDISDVERIVTTAGTFVLKSHPRSAEGLFESEAAGLLALRRSGTTLRVPDVIACGDGRSHFLVLEDLGSASPPGDVDDRIGRGLADLHRAGSARFGFERDGFCGATPQPNPWTDAWVAFYRESRLRHQARLARAAGLLSEADTRRIDGLLDRLDTLIDEPPEGPALIHGDLWSGNLLIADDGSPALIDPAAYFAHREAELGMMTLFGGFPARVYAAYEDAFPLEPGWRDRNPLYRLYHLLNHLNLFGRTYHGQVMAIVNRHV